MGKFDSLKTLKRTSARVAHLCSKCGGDIAPGQSYYKEHIQDKFLQSLNARKFCAQCFGQHGEALLNKNP
jgi:hypothetical protein